MGWWGICSARWLGGLVGAMLALSALPGHAMDALDDRALSAVQGRDGLYFNLVNFSLSGPLTLTYTSPAGATLALSNLAISRSDDLDRTFTDPYSLTVQSRAGAADVIELSLPLNAAGLQRWQFAADMSVTASGLTMNNGALMLQDLALYGGGLQLSTPGSTGLAADAPAGLAFGLKLRADLGALVLRPRGRDDASDELRIAGLRLGAVTADGSFTQQPWALADVSTQPGLLRALVDDKGPAIQIAVDWSSSAAGAPLGGLSIDSVRFANASGVTADLGSSRIATMQLQYLDMRLRPGP